MITKIVQIGQSKAVIINKKICEENDLNIGDFITVSFNHKIVETDDGPQYKKIKEVR